MQGVINVEEIVGLDGFDEPNFGSSRSVVLVHDIYPFTISYSEYHTINQQRHKKTLVRFR